MLVQATADLAVDAKNCSVGKGSAIPGYHSCNAPRIPKGRPGDAGGSDDTMNPTEEEWIDGAAVHLKSRWDPRGTTPPHGQMSGRKSTDSLCG